MTGTYNRLKLHVSASDMTVIRAARGRLNKADRTSRAAREDRHWFYRQMLIEHRKAGQLYHAALTGRFS